MGFWPFNAPGAAALVRGIVVGSMLLAVAAGSFLVAEQGWAAASLAAGSFLLGAIGGRVLPVPAAGIVLALGPVHYGVLRLALGPALAALPLWLAAFSGLMVGISTRGGWQTPPLWRVPLAWWAVSVAVSWPIILLREMDFALDGPRGTTPLIIPSALLQMSVALWMDWLIGTGGGSRESGVGREAGIGTTETGVDGSGSKVGKTPVFFARAILCGAIASALAAIYQRFVDPAWLSGPPWSEMGRSVGLMGDANPLGVLAAIFAPLSFLLLRRPGSESEPDAPASRGRFPTRTAVAGAIAALLWAAAWFSGARSMLIITAAGISGLLFEWLRARLGLARAAIVGGAAIALAVAALAVAAPRAQPGTPLERFFRYLPRTSVADGAYELFWRRDGYGLAAVQAFRESPASGVGIGTFTTWSPAYFREAGGTYTIPPDNAQNLWRHVLAERGVLGLLPVAWLTVLAIATLPGGGPIVLRAVLAGVGVTLLFGFPVQESAIAVTIGLLVALARVPREGLSAEARAIQRATADSSPEFPTKVQDRSWWLLAVLAVSLVAAGIDVAAARGKMRLPARAARFGLPYNWGFGEQEQAPGGVTARAFRGHAALVRPAATNRFELRGWVRSPEGDAHIRIWNAGTLIFNVSVPHGGTFAQTINVPPGGRSVWLDFHTSRGDVLVSGTFEGSVAP